MVIGSLEARERLALLTEVEMPAVDEVSLLLAEIEKLDIERRELISSNEDLKWHAAHMEDSRRRLVEAHESAKRAVAEELHGRVQTLLYANWFKLSNLLNELESREAPEAAELSELVNDLNLIREEEVRKLAHRLHPSVIRLGLAAAMRSLVTSMEDLIETKLIVSDAVLALEPDGKSDIPDDVRLGIYRVAEMAIGNVIKHSKAEHCIVEFDIDDGEEFVFSVTDDGVGFPPAASASTGMGVATMDDYADALGGKFKITSLPGEGTRVEMRIPLSSWSSAGEQHPAAIGTLVDMHWAAPQKTPSE